MAAPNAGLFDVCALQAIKCFISWAFLDLRVSCSVFDIVTGDPFKQSAELTGEPIKMKRTLGSSPLPSSPSSRSLTDFFDQDPTELAAFVYERKKSCTARSG